MSVSQIYYTQSVLVVTCCGVRERLHVSILIMVKNRSDENLTHLYTQVQNRSPFCGMVLAGVLGAQV